MAVQQNKVSKSRRNNRRAHDSLNPSNPNECPNCGELKRPHHICSSCGYYGEKEVILTAEEIDIDEDAAYAVTLSLNEASYSRKKIE